MVLESYYSMLTSLFTPILSLPSVIAELLIAALMIFVITLFYRFLVDQSKMKEIKNQIKEMQTKIKHLQKTNVDEANKVMAEMLKLSNLQFRMSMKPFLFVFIIAILFLPWMAMTFKGPVVYLPFSLFGINSLGWLAWYIIISIPLNQLFRKALGVE